MSAGSASGSRPSSSQADRHEPRAREAEALQRREVGGALDEDDVARIQQRRRDQPERLLGARRDEQLAGFALQAAPAETLGQQCAQPRVALRRGVLQRARRDGRRERARERVGDELGGEQLGRRQAAREGDHLGALGELEDVAHGGGAHVAQARGERRRGRRHHAHHGDWTRAAPRSPCVQRTFQRCYRLGHGQRRCL